MPISLARFLRPDHVPHDVELDLISQHFEDQNAGYFVDVGAHEGEFSRPFEDKGWGGVLIEPLPEYADRLRKNRRARVVECLVGSPAEQGSKMALFRASASQQSTLHPNEHLLSDFNETIKIQVRTLDSILSECGSPENLDLLKIDVELHEYEVLSGFDFSSWSPSLIIIEDHAYNTKVHKYILANKYKFFKRVNLNNWYVPVQSKYNATYMMRYAFIRKFYLSLPLRLMKRRLRQFARKSGIR